MTMTHSTAKVAQQKTNGYKLDRHHTFVVNSLEEVHKYLGV